VLTGVRLGGVSLADVCLDGCSVAFQGGPEPAPSAAIELERGALRNLQPRRLPDRAPYPVRESENGAVRPSCAACFEAPRVGLRPLERRRDPRVLEHVEMHVHAQPAAVLPGPAGVGCELDLLHEPGVARLPDLRWGEPAGRLPVVDKAARAVAAGVA